MTGKYDPNLRYTWTPSDEFTLTGEEFGMILNAFRAILSSPEAQRILLIEEANKAIENVMTKAVEAGIIKEAPEKEASPLKVVN